MQGLKLTAILATAFVIAACTNHQINFDQLPGGTALPSWDGTSMLDSLNPAVITTQYSSAGVTSIASTGGGVVLLAGQNTSTLPNVACPFGASGAIDYTQPVTITLAQSTDDVWVTIPNGARAVTVSAYDYNGAFLESQDSYGPESTAVSPGIRRVHIANNDIIRVVLSGARSGTVYCLDDFTWQELWY